MDVRWRSTVNLDDLTASALGALGLRSSFGGRDNSSTPASAESYRYPIGNHGRWAARCAPEPAGVLRGVLTIAAVPAALCAGMAASVIAVSAPIIFLLVGSDLRPLVTPSSSLAGLLPAWDVPAWSSVDDKQHV